MAVVGAGGFGRNHLRVIQQAADAELVAVVDSNQARAEAAAAEFGARAIRSLGELAGLVDAAVVAVPTVAHEAVGVELLRAGIDVLVEKPIAPTLAAAQSLVDTAAQYQRILQVGHLERFNPAIRALREAVARPLFFEIHRLSLFTLRSLDVDVVLDLMIHDLDIVLSLVGREPEEIRAAGISILSPKVDIANVRLAFPGGCIANLTASRVSTERVRKLRLFQPQQYLSLDYQRQDVVQCGITPTHELAFGPLPVVADEPLRAELEAFFHSVRTRTKPEVSGLEGAAALSLALRITAAIEQHSALVAAG